MNDPDEELRKAVALFRYGLIADVLRLPPGSGAIRRTLNETAQRSYVIPGTRRTRVAVETMRDWLSLYRTGGFEALYPKTRTDRGLSRRLPPEVAEVLLSLKSEQPALSVKALIKPHTSAASTRPAREDCGIHSASPPCSCVHGHLWRTSRAAGESFLTPAQAAARPRRSCASTTPLGR